MARPEPVGGLPAQRQSTPTRTASSSPERIETARMIGERLALEHEQDLVRLLLDPGVAETIWSPHEMRTAWVFHRRLGSKLAHWEHTVSGSGSSATASPER